MMHQKHRKPFVVMGFVLLMALVLAVPTWAAAATAPIAVGVGASTTFSGTGFVPGESLALWETGADNNPAPLGTVQADASGNFTTTVSFPSAGAWTATAHSINTGKEYIGNFTVGAASGTTTAPILGAPAAPSSGTTGTGTSIGVGSFTTFSGSGFTANENISVWETGPDGSASTVTALPGIQADGTGAFTDSVSFPSAGNWQVTAQGVASGHQVISPFAVGVPGAAPAASAGALPLPTGTGTVGGPGFNGTPATTGTAVTFAGSGFTANEQISLWTTAPDSSTAALSSVQADSTGAFTDSVIFPSAGNWQVTAQGHTSGHQVIGRYAVSDSSTGTTDTTSAPAAGSPFTSPFADVPVKATVGTIAAYTATGFNAGETVFAWVTPPDGSAVTSLDQVQASSTGRATVSTSFGSAGLWQITLHGRDSGHETVGKFQVTTT